MAVANSLAAVKNGAGRVEGTINGIGERAGNAALEEIAVALNIRQDYYQAETSIVLMNHQYVRNGFSLLWYSSS